jgi:fatty-acyl-CoA synthase
MSKLQPLSVARGIPLEQEPGLGTLTIPGYLRDVVARYGEREALVLRTAGDEQRWSYAQLWQKSVEVAKALIAAGVDKDGRVGILMTNRPEYLSAVFGTALAGGVSVGLSTFSTPQEMEHLLGASGVSVLLFDGRVLKKDFGAMLLDLDPAMRQARPGQIHSAKFPFLRQLVRLAPVTEGEAQPLVEAACLSSWSHFLEGGAAVDDAVVQARTATVTPSSIGGLFFSSGTTSLPKGILHTQRAFALQWWRYPRLMKVEGAVRSWTGNGFFWSGNIIMSVGLALSTGGAIVLQPCFEPEMALRLIREERVSFLSGRPHQWARLRAAAGWEQADLGSLRYITTGELLKAHPTTRTDWEVPMAYGATETMTINTSNAADASTEAKPGSFGAPVPGNLLKIVDAQTGAVVPLGQHGEICIKGPTLMIGYIGKTPEETFDDEGYFHTGDGGYIDEAGHLFWKGRLTEIIKTGGANVSPLEIDTVLATYPGVRRAQTVGVPHETLGEMVVSCVVPQSGVSFDEAAIRGFLKERLASFKVPRRVLVLHEDEVLVTGNGKVKTAELRELASARIGSAAAI